MSQVKKLKWTIDDRGDYVAIAPNGQYRITFETGIAMGGENGYRVRFAGFPIAVALSDEAAKVAAYVHLNRD